MTGNVQKLKKVRLAFTQNLFTPGTYQNGPGKPKYKCKLLIEKTDPQIAGLKAEIVRLATEVWKEKAQTVLRDLQNSQKFAFCDGDLKEYEGFPGHYYLNVANPTKPLYVGRNPGTIDAPNLITEVSGKLYAGCYVNANVSFWTWTKVGGNQMHCNLLGLQFVADGEAFSGGGTTSVNEFDAETVPTDFASDFL